MTAPTLQVDVKTIWVFWNVSLCQSLSSPWHFEWTMHPVTRHHIPEDVKLNQQCCENPESCTWCQKFEKSFVVKLRPTPTNSCHTFCNKNINLTLLPTTLPVVKSLCPIIRLNHSLITSLCTMLISKPINPALMQYNAEKQMMTGYAKI